MKKTVTITIGGSLFHIEEDAYAALDAYLSSIRAHFATYGDADEIVADIEGRIAEEFTDLLKTNHRAAIDATDVETVSANMGTTEDFAAFEGEGTTKKKSADGEKISFGKKLYRDSEDPMLGGVAAGIAQYLGVDPWIVRLAFAVSVFFGGAGIFLYALLWFIIPEAKTIGDKAEMRGGRLTIEKIEATIREKVPEATKNLDKGALKRAVELPFEWVRMIVRFISRMLAAVFPLLGRIVGVLLATTAMIGLLFLSFWFIIFMTGGWEQYMDIPVRELAGNGVFYAAIVCTYLALLIPGIVVFGIGTSLSKMKNDFNQTTVLTLGGIWLSAVLSGAVIAASNGPAFVTKVEAFVNEFRTETTKDIPLSSFDDIEASHRYHVRIRRGSSYSMTVIGSERAVERLRTDVENGTLRIRQEGRGTFCIFCLDNGARIEITTPGDLRNIASSAGAAVDIEGIAITGDMISAKAGAKVDVHDGALPQTLTVESHAGSRVSADSTTTVTTLTLDAAAGSRIEYEGNATTVKASSNAGSRAVLNGSGATLSASVNAGSRLDAAGFSVTDADVHVTAGGRAEVNASGTLGGSARAGGHIRYVGTPTVTVDEEIGGHVEAFGM